MKKWVFSSASILGLVGTLVVANAQASIIQRIKSFNPYLQFRFAPVWVHASGKQTNTRPNGDIDNFKTSSSGRLNDWSFAVGFDRPLLGTSSWFSRLDADIQYMTPDQVSITGTRQSIPVSGSPESHSYSYKVKTSILRLDVDVDVWHWKNLEAVAGAGLDYDWLKTSDYQEPDSHLTFASRWRNQWFYHVNLGLRYKINKYLRVGIRDRLYPGVDAYTGASNQAGVGPLRNRLVMNQISTNLDILFS